MFNFTVNGKKVSTDKETDLLTYLREVLNLTSAKNGCSEGVCGTCTVIVDGKAVRACTVKTAKLEGKSVVTLEGLDDNEKDVYVYAFGEAGAVQCGFCTPGMVMASKALLDVNNNPSREEVKKALRFNICRCTGYAKIEEAVLLCAKMFREGKKAPKAVSDGKLGDRLHRVDAADKTLGTGIYTDDMRFPGMVYGGALRTKHPRAKILSIKIDKAKAHPKAIGVFTAADITGRRNTGHLVQDWDAMIAVGETTRYLGDTLALAVAETQDALKEVLDLIEVEYEVYEPITSPEKALAAGAAAIHANGNLLKKEVLKRGDAATAIKKSKYVVTHKFSTPFTEHAYLEPECAVAMPEGDGVHVYTSSQSIYDEQREVSTLLGLPAEKVHVTSAYVGGGFGGKEDMTVQHHSAFLAYKTKKTVKVTLSRQESLIVSTKRHAAEMEFTVGVDENGIIQGMKAVIVTDTGAYASLGGPVLQRACTHAAGPYNYQNIDIEGMAVYTNNTPGGAFRGFGVTQSAFAMESILNELAEKVGISPWEIRYRNAIRPGQVLPNGQIADDSTALVETLEAVKEEYEKSKIAGIACAMKNAGLGVGIVDVGRCNIVIINGKAHVRTSAACIGQGLDTILVQVVCETTGLKPENVVVDTPDTQTSKNSGTTTASRQTVFTGEACHVAAKQLKDALKGKTLADLNGADYYGEYQGVTDPMGSDKPNPVSHVAYGYATQVVILDDNGKVQKVIAAHDVGRAINPTTIEGQIEGGVVMGLGYALTEDFPLENSVPKVKYGTLGLFRADVTPEIKPIIIGKNKADLAYGAKGVGEITTIPTAPAVQGAYYVFDKKFRTKLPLEGTAYSKKK